MDVLLSGLVIGMQCSRTNTVMIRMIQLCNRTSLICYSAIYAAFPDAGTLDLLKGEIIQETRRNAVFFKQKEQP